MRKKTISDRVSEIGHHIFYDVGCEGSLLYYLRIIGEWIGYGLKSANAILDRITMPKDDN